MVFYARAQRQESTDPTLDSSYYNPGDKKASDVDSNPYFLKLT